MMESFYIKEGAFRKEMFKSAKEAKEPLSIQCQYKRTGRQQPIPERIVSQIQ